MIYGMEQKRVETADCSRTDCFNPNINRTNSLQMFNDDPSDASELKEQ
jgi:hypothetical protein